MWCKPQLQQSDETNYDPNHNLLFLSPDIGCKYVNHVACATMSQCINWLPCSSTPPHVHLQIKHGGGDNSQNKCNLKQLPMSGVGSKPSDADVGLF